MSVQDGQPTDQNDRDSGNASNGNTTNGSDKNGHHHRDIASSSRCYSLRRYMDEPQSVATKLAVQLLEEPKPSETQPEDHNESLLSEDSGGVADETEAEVEREETEDEEMSDDDDDFS